MGDEVLTLKTSGGRLWEIVHEPIAHAVLSNAQILHGKLDRADASPVRDVFDFIKARDPDPQALSAAVNCRSREDIEVIAITWERADATLRETSTDHLLGIPKHLDEDRSTLESNAADALRGATYSHVTVRTDPAQAIVDTRTNRGVTRRIAIPKDRIRETLASSGLSQYFRTPFGRHSRPPLRYRPTNSFFFRVDRGHRLTQALERPHATDDAPELRIPIRMLAAFERRQQPVHRALADPMAFSPQLLRQARHAAACPAQRPLRVAPGERVEQMLQRVDQTRVALRHRLATATRVRRRVPPCSKKSPRARLRPSVKSTGIDPVPTIRGPEVARQTAQDVFIGQVAIALVTPGTAPGVANDQ